MGTPSAVSGTAEVAGHEHGGPRALVLAALGAEERGIAARMWA
jgi:hypothetical protein